MSGGYISRFGNIELPSTQPGGSGRQKVLSKGMRGDEVKQLQQRLNQILPLTPSLVVDGIFGQGTHDAVAIFQRKVGVNDGMGIVGQRTWQALRKTNSLIGNVGPIEIDPNPNHYDFVVEYRHGNVRPKTTAKDGATILYESTVTIRGRGGFVGPLTGSIYPDNMNTYGRIQDGRYPLYLGFHKRSGQAPSENDLVVRSSGFRAALIVNRDQRVPIHCDSGIPTSGNIHVHNGCNSSRGSHGCLTLQPSHWSTFISFFLDQYPFLRLWTEGEAGSGQYIGYRIAQLRVRA